MPNISEADLQDYINKLKEVLNAGVEMEGTLNDVIYDLKEHTKQWTVRGIACPLNFYYPKGHIAQVEEYDSKEEAMIGLHKFRDGHAFPAGEERWFYYVEKA